MTSLTLEERIEAMEAEIASLPASEDMDTAWIVCCGVLVFCE